MMGNKLLVPVIVLLLVCSCCNGDWNCNPTKKAARKSGLSTRESIPMSVFQGLNKTDKAWLNVKDYQGKPLEQRRSPEEGVKFYLVTHEFPWGIPIERNVKQIKEYGWKSDPGNFVKILIHGFRQNIKKYMVQDIVQAYLQSGANNLNIIAIDWSLLVDGIDYFYASGHTDGSGRFIASFVEFLIENSLVSSYSKVHIIGHSLGAQAAGSVGSHLKSKGHSLGRITGLDPAGPGFGYSAARLDESDADFVDVIHTNMGDLNPLSGVQLGSSLKSGHADFYPNGGKKQPGCGGWFTFGSDVIGTCSHRKAVEYFTNSILDRNAYKSCKCESWSDFTWKQYYCEREVVMGEHCSSNARGEYYLYT